MNVLVFLIPLALGLGLLGLAAFLWSLGARQYEDLDGAAWRVLMDDAGGDPPPPRKPQPDTEAGTS